MSDDLGLWLVDGHECTDGELIALGLRLSAHPKSMRALIELGFVAI